MPELQISDLLRDFYRKKGAIKSLPGEIDLNYKVLTDDGGQYILKIASPTRSFAVLDLENQLMMHLAAKDPSFQIPEPIPTIKGDLIGSWTTDGETRLFRLLTWVEGEMLVNICPHTDHLLFQIGSVCGEISELCKGFHHPAASRDLVWDISKLTWIEEVFPHFDEKEMLSVTHWYDLVREELLPSIEYLPHSVCYHDANDHNILVSADETQVQGIIDFGDCLYTPAAMECALACTYLMMHKTDPLGAAAPIIRGYQSQHYLSEQEVEALPLMIAGRLLLSLSLARKRQLEEPENEYLQVSAEGGWQLLHAMREQSLTFMRATFREAAGYEPVPHTAAIRAYLNSQTFSPILGNYQDNFPIQVLDLSIGSQVLGSSFDMEDTDKLQGRLQSHLKAGSLGIGRYLEPRPFYTSDSYLMERNQGRDWRTVHLGVDMFAPVGTEVYAPINGTVESVTYNPGFRDYGYTVILKHEIDQSGVHFYTLYGHLGHSCSETLKSGQEVEAGNPIGELGDIAENGSWPPHLHFQIITNLLDEEGNFPGVAIADRVSIWKSISPDPNLLLKLPMDITYQWPAVDDLLQTRSKLLANNLSLSYYRPLMITRGDGAYLLSVEGRRYLDLVNNVAHVGHEHPKVVEAGQKQMAVLNTNTRYLHPNILELAERLIARMPNGLDTVFVTNSGSEANELAFRIAKTFTSGDQFIAIEHGYHGNTNACIDVSSYKFDGPGGSGCPEHVHLIPMADPYRGRYAGYDDQANKYAAHVDQCVQTMTSKGKGLAAFIGETILSCGGQVVPPPGYLSKVYQKVRAAGGLCIADEVQTGCGRMGSHFWAFETQAVIPDIVTIGKPIGNGHPLGVVVTTRAIADAFGNGMEYFNTFGGNPVSCAVGSAVLDVIEEEGLQDHAKKMGNYLLNRLRELGDASPIIGDVRGIGLFLGIELVRDKTTREPHPHATHYLVNRLCDQAILLSTDGPDHNVIKIKPPLAVSKDDLDYFLRRFSYTLQDSLLRKL